VTSPDSGRPAPPAPVSRKRPTFSRLFVVTVATMVTILVVLIIDQDVGKQPLLVASLASSSFLMYYQPLNEVNRFGPLVLGQLTCAVFGFLANLLLRDPLSSAAVAVSFSVVAMMLLRIVHPPAVATSLVFAYRPHGVSALGTFFLTLLVVLVLAAVYVVLNLGIRPSRWAAAFGFEEIIL
jgi:CBS-domain-containing membrane protein